MSTRGRGLGGSLVVSWASRLSGEAVDCELAAASPTLWLAEKPVLVGAPSCACVTHGVAYTGGDVRLGLLRGESAHAAAAV